MNLEAIEQRTLRYLKQAVNPLVPFDTLRDHLSRETDLGSFTDVELLAFLRNHELFEVIDPVQFDAQDLEEADLSQAGLQMTPHVILTTRVPTQRQMAEQMGRQLDALVQTLSDAMAAAKQTGQPAKAQALIRLLDRAQELQQRVARFV